MVVVRRSDKPIPIGAFPLIIGRAVWRLRDRGIRETQEMLDFLRQE